MSNQDPDVVALNQFTAQLSRLQPNGTPKGKQEAPQPLKRPQPLKPPQAAAEDEQVTISSLLPEFQSSYEEYLRSPSASTAAKAVSVTKHAVAVARRQITKLSPVEASTLNTAGKHRGSVVGRNNLTNRSGGVNNKEHNTNENLPAITRRGRGSVKGAETESLGEWDRFHNFMTQVSRTSMSL